MMNKTVKIVLAVLVVIFMVLPALGWFLYHANSEDSVVKTETVEIKTVETFVDEQ